MWHRVDLVWIDVSEERIASIFKVEKSANEEPARAGGCRLHDISSLADFSTLKMEAIRFSETSVHARSTRLHIQETAFFIATAMKISNLTWNLYSVRGPEFEPDTFRLRSDTLTNAASDMSMLFDLQFSQLRCSELFSVCLLWSREAWLGVMQQLSILNELHWREIMEKWKLPKRTTANIVQSIRWIIALILLYTHWQQ
jgi:hypothetical protein